MVALYSAAILITSTIEMNGRLHSLLSVTMSVERLQL